MVGSLEMLSGRFKKEYAKEAQSVVDAGDEASSSPAPAANGAPSSDLEAVVAM